MSRNRKCGSGLISVQTAATSADQDVEFAVQSGRRADPLRGRHGTLPQPSIPAAPTMSWTLDGPSACTEIEPDPNGLLHDTEGDGASHQGRSLGDGGDQDAKLQISVFNQTSRLDAAVRPRSSGTESASRTAAFSFDETA
jgi:hypothetical protein